MQAGQTEVSFNLLDSNEIKSEYRVIMGTPGHGTLTSGSLPGAYQYTVNPTFWGTDSVTYQICQGEVCKPGVIYFIISPPHCRIKAFDDSFVKILDDSLLIPILDNDSATCGNVHLQSIAYNGAGTAEISRNSVMLRLPDFYEGTVNFSYTIENGDSSSSANATIQVRIDEAYCNQRFKALDDTLTFYPNFNFRIFNPGELIVNDVRCVSSTNLSSFEIINPPSDSLYEVKKQNNRWWFIVKNPAAFTTGTFQYRICTNSSKCDTANVLVRKQ